MAFAAMGVDGGGPQKTKTPTRVATRAALLLLAPGLAYLALFFLTPFFSLVMLSLRPNVISGAQGFDAGNYIYSLTEFLPQVLTSFSYALLATVFALALSYPIAYYIGAPLKASSVPTLHPSIFIPPVPHSKTFCATVPLNGFLATVMGSSAGLSAVPHPSHC